MGYITPEQLVDDNMCGVWARSSDRACLCRVFTKMHGVHVKKQVTFQLRGEVEGTRCGSTGLVGAVMKMPLSWHALAKCGRLKQGSPCFSQDHWQIPWISLSVRWIEVRRCAERPCCDLEGDWVCSVAVARVVQDVVVCGVFCAC